MGLVKDSKVLKEALKQRLSYIYPSNTKVGIKISSIVKDSQERGFNLSSDLLSRYFSDKPQKSTMSETQLIWLAIRYGIPIQLSIGEPEIINESVKYIIPKFNKSESLKKLKAVFNNA